MNHVITVLDPIWYALPETAKRVHGRIEAILSLAKTRGHRTGENPAAWRDNLKNVYKPKPKLVRGHFTSMDYEDAPGFVLSLQAPSSMSALVNEWIVLTVLRDPCLRGDLESGRSGRAQLDDPRRVNEGRQRGGGERRRPCRADERAGAGDP